MAFSVTVTMINSLHSFPYLILCDCVSRYIILYYKAELQSLHNLSKSCVFPVEEHNANAGSLTPEPKSLATKSILALLRTDTGWSNSQESSRFWSSPTWWLVHIPMVQRTPRSMQSDGGWENYSLHSVVIVLRSNCSLFLCLVVVV